jgi:spore coat protein CotH
MEAAVNAGNYQNATNGFRKYIDTPSFLRRFLAVELSGNTDSYWSYYIYKKRNDDKFYSSPIWDLDLAFENDHRTYPINTRTGDQWIYASTGSTANGMRSLLNRILSDPALVEEMKNIYAEYRDKQQITAERLLQFTDSLAEVLDVSQQLNFTRWPVMNEYVHENPVIHGSYAAEVENVKNYIADRVAWMDDKMNYTPTKLLDLDAFTGKNCLQVYSLQGNVIRQQNIRLSEIPLIMRDLASGCYILRYTGAGKTRTMKWIVE